MAFLPSARAGLPRGGGFPRRSTHTVRTASLIALIAPLSCEGLVGIDDRWFATSPQGDNVAGGGHAGEGMPGGLGGSGGGRRGGSLSGSAGSAPGAGRSGRGGEPGAGGEPESPNGGGGAPGGEAGTAGVTDSPDHEPPTILPTLPRAGERGVDATAVIVVPFSEPMRLGTVVYTQSRGAPSFGWSVDQTTLTVAPGLDRPRSTWVDDEREGTDDDLVVTFGIAAGAADLASNELATRFEATFFLARRVEHRHSLCAARSGAAELSTFQSLQPGVETCEKPTSDPSQRLLVGDRNGGEVMAVMSYELRLPSDAEVRAASLELPFDGVQGDFAQHGALKLEWIDAGADPSGAFSAVPAEDPVTISPLDPNTSYRKDVTTAVVQALAEANEPSRVRFRLRFDHAVLDLAPDYVWLAPPVLELEYDCAACRTDGP
jgi:hypothetical protein